jgi:deoxyhypusine synthase
MDTLSLRKPVKPLQVKTNQETSGLLQEMGKTAFQGKNLSLAFQIWNEMLK